MFAKPADRYKELRRRGNPISRYWILSTGKKEFAEQDKCLHVKGAETEEQKKRLHNECAETEEAFVCNRCGLVLGNFYQADMDW